MRQTTAVPSDTQRDAEVPASAGVLERALTALFGGPAAGWLAPLIQPYRAHLGGLFALSIIAAGAALVPPYLTKLVIDQGLVAGDAGALVFWSVAFFAFGLATLGLGAINSLYHMRVSARMLIDIRQAVLGNVLGQSPRWHADQRTGETLSRFDGDAGEVQQFAVNALLSGSGAVLKLVGGAAMLFVLEWRLALVALLLAPIELLFFAWARPRTEARAHELRAARGHLASETAETVSALPVIQALGIEPQTRERFDQVQSGLLAALLRSQRWGEFIRAVPLSLTALVRSIIFILGGLMVIREGWPLGSLIAFTAYVGFLIGPMQSLISLWHAKARTKASVTRLMALALARPDVADPPSPVALPDGDGAIRCVGLVVRMPGADTPVFDGFDLDISGGSKTLIRGPSGVGKSTLASLLQRHLDPDQGAVRLDGTDLRELALDELRRAVVLVPQRGVVFHGTVGDNLRLVAPDAEAAALEQALGDVGLWAELGPRGGLDALIGEQGLRLSGGQRQRIALARALLTDPRVLILDESLSEIDPSAAAAILRRIDRLFADRTRIVIAHHGYGDDADYDRIVDLGPALEAPA